MEAATVSLSNDSDELQRSVSDTITFKNKIKSQTERQEKDWQQCDSVLQRHTLGLGTSRYVHGLTISLAVKVTEREGF